MDSNNPLTINEELFIENEFGLDAEIISYIKESHNLQIKIGAEPFYLWKRVDQGSLISKSITSWLTTSPQYSAYIWQPSDGEQTHPNSRMQQNKFDVFNGSTKLTRVYDAASIVYDNEYALETLVGSSSATANSVKIWFNTGFVPSAVSYSYYNICACVDSSTGYPNRECPLCRGTSYPAAFEQYTSAATKYNAANTILVRVPMAAETLTPDQIGRVLRRDLRHWTLASPIINNFDLIMGTTGRNAGVLFEIVSKSDSRWRGIITRQDFNTIRIEETDIRYNLAPILVDNFDQDVITLTSNAVIL